MSPLNVPSRESRRRESRRLLQCESVRAACGHAHLSSFGSFRAVSDLAGLKAARTCRCPRLLPPTENLSDSRRLVTFLVVGTA